MQAIQNDEIIHPKKKTFKIAFIFLFVWWSVLAGVCSGIQPYRRKCIRIKSKSNSNSRFDVFVVFFFYYLFHILFELCLKRNDSFSKIWIIFIWTQHFRPLRLWLIDFCRKFMWNRWPLWICWWVNLDSLESVKKNKHELNDFIL